MTVLSEVYSAHNTSEVILHVLEIMSEGWDNPIVLVQDYANHTITTEDGRTLTALASGIDIALPKRDASGAQNLKFAIDGVRPMASKLIRESVSNQKQIKLTYRTYLSGDLSHPADKPLPFIVRGYTAKEDHVEITAGLFDMIDMKWPRITYNTVTAPCLKYTQ